VARARSLDRPAGERHDGAARLGEVAVVVAAQNTGAAGTPVARSRASARARAVSAFEKV
jgi:hypothetical protein